MATETQASFADGDSPTAAEVLAGLPSRKIGPIKRFLPKSLMARAILIIVVPVILVQLITSFVFYNRHWENMSRRLAEGLAGDLQTILYLWERYPDDRLATLALARRAMGLRIVFKEGDTLLVGADGGHSVSILTRLLSESLSNKMQRPFRLYVPFLEKAANIDIQLPDGVMYVTAPRNRLFSSTTYIFILWMVGSAMVLFAVAIVFMRNQIRPVRRLARAADAFGKGLEIERFKPEGGIEVRQAAVAFLIMKERIKRQIGQRTEMLAGVSHDLRTPLTRMRLQLEMLGDGPETDNLKADVAEMEHMIQEYLDFARGAGTEAPEPVDLPRALLALAADFARQDESFGLDVRNLGERSASVSLRPKAFRRCVANLISNALRHGDTVSLTAWEEEAAVCISVDDDGPGIPPDSRSEVFRPFRRLEPSRNTATGGVGLGLTIARDIVRGHGGEIELDDSPFGGLRALIRLPL